MTKGISEKIRGGLLKICDMFFLIFEKGNKQKNPASLFKICKYTFFNI